MSGIDLAIGDAAQHFVLADASKRLAIEEW
jgi:hypothetical protein